MGVVEKKAEAYDLLANIEFLQRKLNEVNMEIAKLAKEEIKEKTE